MISALVFLFVAGITLALYGALLLRATRARGLDWAPGYTGKFTWLSGPDIPFIVDPRCPKDTIYFMDTAHMWPQPGWTTDWMSDHAILKHIDEALFRRKNYP